ncbi:MAG: nuclear transport factor 2 family protein [Flavobacteriaceae bacterium]
MKKLFLMLSLVLIISCDQSSNDSNQKNKEIFDKNVSTIKYMLNGFYAEDSDKFMSVFADSLKWSGPDKVKLNEYESIEVLENALKGYMSLYDNHKLKDIRFFGGSVYSDKGTGSDNPNAIRVFGNWHHTHTETQVDVTHKWVGIMWFNEDGKIYQFSDFFDVGGFINQHLEE